MPGRLDGEVAIVTGAGRGLGRAMTLGLLDAGAGVNGRRFIAVRWDNDLPPAAAAKKVGAPMAWQQLGWHAVLPGGWR